MARPRKSGKAPSWIGVGIGGWTFEPWRGTFYPDDLAQKRELEFASRALTSIEINGTYYSSFKPAIWRKWRDETPEGFRFTVKASRYCTNRRVLAEAGPSIEKFTRQGLTELGDRLGPVNWQFMPAKTFDRGDFAAFLDLLPDSVEGVPLRHALEVRHPSFEDPEFVKLARERRVAVVYAEGEDHPKIDAATTDFRYARIMTSRESRKNGLSPAEVSALAARCRGWAEAGDVYLYFIGGAKVRNPQAAAALIARLEKD